MQLSFSTILPDPGHDHLVARAERYLSATPRPFLKWAGSKRRLLTQIVPHLPPSYRRYYEPFLGGGSPFFLLCPRHAELSDACGELIETYKAVRDNSTAVLRYLSPLRPDRDLYYRTRDARSRGRFKRAAEFIYLNKTCWNGLYRVNQQGKFNVPYGRPSGNYVADAANINMCSEALLAPGVSLVSCDFEVALLGAGRGDLVILDPPYATGHSNNGFVDYNEVLFSWHDQERLASLARTLHNRGAHVLVTNADHHSITELYSDFEQHRIAGHSTISGRSDRRRKKSELLFVGKGWSG